MTYKTVMVTGAAGLIGSAVVRLLTKENIQVIGCDNFSIGRWRANTSNIIWEEIDVSRPLPLDRFSRYHVDYVVHCAAHPGGRSLVEPSKDVQVNAFGSMQIFEWCATNSIPVLFTSSSSIYGDQPEGKIREDAELKPGTIYGVCKLACEKYLEILGNECGLNWTVLRLFSTYGAGHAFSEYQGIINIMLKQLLDGDTVIVKGPLSRQKDYIYVDDAALAIYKCMSSSNAFNNIINIGTGISTTVVEMIKALCEVLSRDMDNIKIVEEKGSYDPLYNVPDCTKAKQLINFNAQYKLYDGLKDYLTKLKLPVM